MESYWRKAHRTNENEKITMDRSYSEEGEIHLLRNKLRIGIHTKPGGEEDKSKSGKGPFWRKHEAMLRRRPRESDGHVS